MLDLSLIEVCVLDFDDVVVRGSEEMKHQAWEVVFPRAEHLAIQRQWSEHFANGKGSRFDILRETLKEIADYGDDLEREVSEKADAFNQAVQAGIIGIGVHPEDRKALEWLVELDLRPYINSATPQAAMEETITALGLGDIVAGVFGHQSAASKINNLRRAAEREQVAPKTVLFVGDSDGDVKAADQFGCHFIGIATERNDWHTKRPDLTLIDNLGQLSELLSD